MRKQLLEDFNVHARRLSDSSVRSGGPVWKRDEADEAEAEFWKLSMDENDPWSE
jgi:hypothetical protein